MVVIIIHKNKISRYNDLLRVRVPTDLKAKLNAVAEERGEDTADVVRRFCEEGLHRHYAENNMDFIKVEIREALRDVLKPSVERLAKIGAKGSVSAGTAMYMLVESLGRQNLDVKDIYSRARIKSVESLRSKGDIDE
ncbi:hypothetical protein AB3H50_28475 [Bacillus pacificus]|uniref:Uncharacterized protein n=1 Tax=Bacillus cereus TaxID=1396 RepID=A0A2A8ZYD8_BACCE|nr:MULTISPECIES: hypothetical protein [Bacillus cereus group]OJE44565.1 hypothetical protein BAQ44_04645 [Bacillus mobilis]PEC51359.1 hypothetical protein CON05_28970 [Bacillus cereus]PFE13428.1 hypothetical protein CN307_17735 [Bacillus cereus]PFE40071.1 hypothetical protein CN317_28355 [Bacillus cereus]PFN62337.1 hypothetical protein COJ75_04265 [Bacillus thuringiensis]